MRSRTSVSESRLGEWQMFQKMGAAGAPRFVPTMVHGAWFGQRGKFWMSTAFSRKMASSAPYRFSAHSRVRSLTCCLPFYTFRMEAAPGSAVPRPSRFVPKLVDSAKTTESKMALKFAHLVSALPHGASRHS